jgi:3D-(3,5/4)-trihydroxycyclohexane-1,2-dione acylhydrolase (decyclizing)
VRDNGALAYANAPFIALAALSYVVRTVDKLDSRDRLRAALLIRTHPSSWTDGTCWEVDVPEVPAKAEVADIRTAPDKSAASRIP